MSMIIGQAGPVTITRRDDGNTMIEFTKSGPCCITIGALAWQSLVTAVNRAVATDKANR